MEVGTEISQKIRSAIKAKLLELGSYVDDELPDYIMVMVANKKTRSQMNSDLGLFLATNTNAFTEWLHGLLEKLQTIRIDSDKSSSKQEKSDKHKSSKDKNKEKSQKGESSGKKSNKDRERKNISDSVDDSQADSSKHKSDHVETEKVISKAGRNNDLSQGKNVENENKKISETESLNGNIQTETQASERDKSIIEDFEDVRQLLVTDAHEDELAEELETTEIEALKSRKAKDVVEKETSSHKNARSFYTSRLNQRNTTLSQSPENQIVKEASGSRRRKALISVVKTISRRDETEEEYDPHNPAVGSVASVVQVTARKSSVPPMMQANSLLLLKAMTEAEKSVAAKKQIVMTKPASNDNAEVYSPKRKSGKSRDQNSPPPYIPSKKEPINRNGSVSASAKIGDGKVLTRNDARHVINKESNRAVMSRSYDAKNSKTVRESKESSHRVARSRSPDRSRKHKENEREVKSDKGFTSDKNFRITCHVSPESQAHLSERRWRHSPSPEPKNLQVTFNQKTADSRPATARLGKIIVERTDSGDNFRETLGSKTTDSGVRETVSSKSTGRDIRDAVSVISKARVAGETVDRSSDEDERQSVHIRKSDARDTINARSKDKVERENVSTRSSSGDARESRHQVTSTRQRDAREDIIAKARQSNSKEKNFQKQSGGRGISSLGKEAVQKQCEAAVISVQAAGTAGRMKRKMSPDSRVVECDTQDDENEEELREAAKKSKRVERGSLKLTSSSVDVVKGGSLDVDDDDDDLAKMIDEDLGPELLDDTNNNFTLDLDIDDDLSKVLGIPDDDLMKADNREEGKDDKRSGTRFIVTLDGVDERQFRAEDNSRVFEKFKRPPVGSTPAVVVPVAATTSVQLQPSQDLFVDHILAQNKHLLQTSQQQVPMIIAAVPSKLTPPKIQPFSISLKDSDDEHDEKEGKTSSMVPEYYQPAEGETSALKKAKMSERCKFWPACAAGSSCEFHHPTTICKTFPSCKFGDKCLFIHPNCRFDSKCARPDCPYTHTSRRPALSGPTQMIAIPPPHFVFSAVKPKFVAPLTTQTVCRYFPNCQNANCLFLHPKHCNFGIACKSQSCPFYHPPNPGWHKLKWQAGGTGGQVRAEVTTSQSVTKEGHQPTPKNDPVPPTCSPPSPNYSTAVSSTSK